MFKRVFVFLALAFALFATQGWAATCSPPLYSEVLSCTNTFSPGVTTNTYNFTGTGDGILIVHFTTVLTTFDLTVTVNHPTDPLPLDPSEFPTGTVCVKYIGKGTACDRYDFSGTATTGGFNGVPVKNKDYKGRITLTLTYSTGQTIHEPAFGHAPGDILTFLADILVGYFSPVFSDPTMIGDTPDLSSVVALDEPSNETNTFCFVPPLSVNDPRSFTVGTEIEVAFQLSADTSGNCPITGKPLRDKTAKITVAVTDSFGDFISLAKFDDKGEGNKFHWEPKEGENEFDLDTGGLAPGDYTITVRSRQFSPPQSVRFSLTP